jgi:hypothetical protein
MLSIFIYITILSAVGIIYLLAKGLAPVKTMSRNELRLRLASSNPMFHDINTRVFSPFWNYLKMPRVFKEFEIIISKFRIITLRMERRLFELANYIRGKRNAESGNGGNSYWNSVHDSKNKADKKPK